MFFFKTKLFCEHQIIQIRATTPTKIEFSPPSLCPLANSLAYDMGFGGDNLVRYMNHSHRKWGSKASTLNPGTLPQTRVRGVISTWPCKNLSHKVSNPVGYSPIVKGGCINKCFYFTILVNFVFRIINRPASRLRRNRIRNI